MFFAPTFSLNFAPAFKAGATVRSTSTKTTTIKG
jgi:hypothetical protein